MAAFFVRDLGLALATKTCPHPTVHRPSKRSIMVRCFRRMNFFFFPFFSERTGSRYLKARLRKNAQMFQELTR